LTGVLTIKDLRTEYHVNPIGVDIPAPRLSWKMDAEGARNILQTSYHIRCARSPEALNRGFPLVWDSGEVASDRSVHVEYEGLPPGPGERIYWKVKASAGDRHSGWSEPAFWETGLMDASAWKAQWIEADLLEDPDRANPAPLLRKEFRTQKMVIKAILYVTARGLYRVHLNGVRAGDQEFTPGWTSYHKRLQYQVYDVTGMVKNGDNAIGVILGDGWYRGNIGWQGERNLYGDKTALLLQLKITFYDGSALLVFSDGSWKSSTGPILSSEIYHGEVYDARLEKRGWDLPGYDDSDWAGVLTREYGYDSLTATVGPPVRVTREIKPTAFITTPLGERVLDFGQNLAGRIQFQLLGIPGGKITLLHAEVLDKDGNFYTENLRAARQKVEYIFKGREAETYEPHFTWMGFRYVKVADYAGVIDPDRFTARVLHSGMELTGTFECSSPLVNQLQHNILWSLRGNFLDVPTDCPQRDERLGWTGDALVFAPTACFNVNAAPFFSKWLKDLYADQRQDGAVPWVVPMMLTDGGGTGWSDGYGAAGWADAAVMIPWVLYQQYGDERILMEQYSSMKGWVDFMVREAGESCLFTSGFHFGDWLSFAEYYSQVYNAPDYGFAGAHTEKELIATVFFYRSTDLLARIASILGKVEDAAFYSSLLPRIQKAFREEFITPNGRLVSDTQTAYALALAFGILPQEMVRTAAARLAANVTRFRHLTTGFLGTPLLLDALTDAGYPGLAYQLLLNTSYPSWLYPVTRGATTIWERWDGIRPDGSFQDPGMNSFNHYAYGAVGNWLYSRVAGIQSDLQSAGYKKIIIRPVISPPLTHACATYQSMYGEITSGWEVNGTKLILRVTIPANATAQIHIPASCEAAVTEHGIPIEKSGELENKGTSGGCRVVECGSGIYHFETCLPSDDKT
jgi:alpha-L-rhamnosidase